MARRRKGYSLAKPKKGSPTKDWLSGASLLSQDDSILEEMVYGPSWWGKERRRSSIRKLQELIMEGSFWQSAGPKCGFGKPKRGKKNPALRTR